MSKHADYVPKHRQPVDNPLTAAPRKALRKALILSSTAVAVTGVTVGGGVALSQTGQDTTQVAAALPAAAPAGSTSDETSEATADGGAERAALDPELAEELQERSETEVSRSQDRRKAVDSTKARALSVLDADASAVTEREDLSTGDPRDIASAMLSDFGWSGDQFGCLDSLWTRESGWSTSADNPSSSAYGIPQALPGSKMASAGSDWATNPATQIKWGLGYIQDRYGSPCGAWSHSESNGWY
ncbi:lytic transglycosylase domain-containing protein [Nocardioides insulae]|uniref:aggregation-promoting factor C-terminal-like domain-containing protein n=1 Tax=Nocardioides insulae TaxID=394734 RepID=UPI000425CAE9|nr:lytic transglycosylase domain-containing protein [Nocardioides insulae]